MTSKLTHVWVEVPFLSDALTQLPADVEIYIGQLGVVNEEKVMSAQVAFASAGVAYNADLFQRLPNLRMVQRTGIGYDNVNLEDATQYGVVACNTPDGPTESTAEHTVAMLLNLAKRLKQGNDNLAAGKFGPRNGPLLGMEVQGKILGLIGLGRIGRRVAQICGLGLGMRVLAYDPYITPEQAAQMGVEQAELADVIRQSDFLSLHVPVTPDTRSLMDATRISQMKQGAYLINCARGPLVDPVALVAAVDSGHLAGAGIDVFDPEPPVVGDVLRDHPLIVATPHSATVTTEGRVRIEEMAVARVNAFFRGERPSDVLNPAVYTAGTLR